MKKITGKARAKEIAKIASDHKAHDIVVLDLQKIASFTDFFIICSGYSDRQVRAIADAIIDEEKKKGRRPIGQEGFASAKWILLDYGDVVIHIFYDPERHIYQLEDLWFDAPKVSFKGITKDADVKSSKRA